MIKHSHSIRIILLFCSMLMAFSGLKAQEKGYEFSGKVLESGSGKVLSQVVISVASTGEFTNTDSLGVYSIVLPTEAEMIRISYPGYHTAEFYTHGQESMEIFLTPDAYASDGEVYSSTLESGTLREANSSLSILTREDLGNSAVSSVDQALSGRVAGLHVIEHSGMPGHSSWLNIRGISSLFGRNQPLVYIDGMIHEINYANNYLIEGHLFNPMDIVDIDDVVDFTVIKTGEGQLGSAGSNGILYINTEQKRETSASILIKMYGGIALPPDKLDVMNAGQFGGYFSDLLSSEGYSTAQITTRYPWLYGGGSYRYGNDTKWQEELYRPSAYQKYYIFLKGGDDIATYNISSGYLRQGAPYDQWWNSRYNLRLNGKINITNKLSIVPNTKLSLTDSYLTNMGPTTERNPVVSSLLKSPRMTAHERSEADGTELFPYDDVGVFNISNPAVLIDGALGSDRNFQLVTSVRAAYEITPKLTISHLIGTSVNNDRVNIFIPDVGVVQIDSARNSPQDMVTEFRSTQNHTIISYKDVLNHTHHLNLYGGMRYLFNTYKNNLAIDLNTPSDDFRSLGQGSEYEYLQSNGGELSEMKWLSYFADLNYSYRDRYYLRFSSSYDASSVFNDQNRWNFYPSVFGAWRLSSEDFMDNSRINDLKLRASWSQTGNMFSSIYNYSKLTYTGRMYTDISRVVRDYNPNPDLRGERKSMLDVGLDISFAKRSWNMHLDAYYAVVNNLVINQLLPYNFGFTDYFDNGGSLTASGVEFSTDTRFYLGRAVLLLDATATYQASRIKNLDFLNPETEFITKEVFGAEYIAMEGNPVNAFYGYKTNGIYNTDEEANGIIGPNGWEMGAGDVIFEDVDGNHIINDGDKQIIGDPNPDLFGSLASTLSFKKWDFSALLTYSIGNQVYNYVRQQITSMDTYANQSTDVLNRWYPGATHATLPRASIGDQNGNNVFSDRWIENGSYLRLRQLTVRYKASRIFSLNKEAVFYITGTNLFTLTGYSGLDPETLYLNDPFYMGIDYGTLPLARSVILGIQLSL